MGSSGNAEYMGSASTWATPPSSSPPAPWTTWATSRLFSRTRAEATRAQERSPSSRNLWKKRRRTKTKKKEEKKPEPKPFKMPKKVEKKPEPEPEPVPEEPKKIVKKKPSVKPKEEPKEEEAPFAMKLKKTERVQREWKDPEMETVKLAHHEFEKAPQPVEPEGKSTVKLGQPLEIEGGGNDDEDSQKKKRKKKKKAKADGEDSEEGEEKEDEEEGQKDNKVKKSVSFNNKPEIKTFESETESRTTKTV